MAARMMLFAWLAGAVLVAAWTVQDAELRWPHAAGWAAVALAGLAVGLQLHRPVAGILSWDGQAWVLVRQGQEGRGEQADEPPTVALDLQESMLLRWHSAAGTRWLWLEPGHDRMAWRALRRAVYSRAIPDALQGAEPPSAMP